MSFDRLFLLKVAAPAAMAVGLFTVFYVAASAPSVEAKRLGLRGLKRQRALETVPFWSMVEPLVRWLGARVAGLIPADNHRELNRKISLAGDFMGLLPEELIGLSFVTTFGGLLLGYVLGWLSDMGTIAVIGGGLLGAVFPYMRISNTAAERMKTVNRRLPAAIDLLALAMGAGLDFPGAVRQVVEKSGSTDDPVVEEFTLLLQSLGLGRTRRLALESFAERVPVDAVVEFTGALIQAELRGNPVVDVLRIQAEVARRKRSVRAEEQAAKAGVALMGPLVLVFLSILILIVAPIVMRIQSD